MRDTLTLEDAGSLIRRLCVAFARPFAAKAAALIDIWHDKLQYFPKSAVVAVVEHWIETGERFPTIGQIRGAVKERTKRLEDGPRNRPAPADEYVCPDCGTNVRSRVWLVPRRTSNGADQRPTVVLVTEADGREVEYLKASMGFCECGWKAKIRTFSNVQRQFHDDPDLMKSYPPRRLAPGATVET